jgi:hypothetical protein
MGNKMGLRRTGGGNLAAPKIAGNQRPSLFKFLHSAADATLEVPSALPYAASIN